jgi:hypothetical protein
MWRMVRLFLAFFILLAACFSTAQTTDGRKSRIPSANLKAVKKTKFRVLVPTYVPVGFRVQSCGLSDDPEPILAVWRISYQNPKTKASVVLQMASEGVGDPMFDLPNGDVVEPNGSIWARSPILGKVEVMYVKKGKLRMANCTWYDVSKKTFPRLAMMVSHGVEPSEIKKMIESLRWLSK